MGENTPEVTVTAGLKLALLSESCFLFCFACLFVKQLHPSVCKLCKSAEVPSLYLSKKDLLGSVRGAKATGRSQGKLSSMLKQ